MSELTRIEKIAVAEAQVKEAENMLAFSRKQVQEWMGRLEIREDYLFKIKPKLAAPPKVSNVGGAEK